MFVDECTTRLMRVSYARLLVEFDVTKLVPRTIHIKDYNGNIIEQKVQYDWVPLFAKNAKQQDMIGVRRMKGNMLSLILK